MTEVLIDGVKQDITPLPMCSRCKSFSYVLHRNKTGALVCDRCVHRREVHKADMAEPEEYKQRGQSPAWEEE